MAFDWTNVVELLGAGIMYYGIQWGFHREDKQKEKDEAERKAELQTKRHEENQQALASINTKLQYNPPHIHTERTGPLCAEGIRYGPRNGT